MYGAGTVQWTLLFPSTALIAPPSTRLMCVRRCP